MTEKSSNNPPKVLKWMRMPEMDTGKRWLLSLFLLMQLVLIGLAIWPAAWLILYYADSAETAFHWSLLIIAAILVFNYAYLLALLVLRFVIPKPKEGFYPLGANRRPPPEAFLFMLNAFLAKARYQTPWAEIFSSALTNIFPLYYIYRRYFGPHTRSLTMGDFYRCFDPHMVEAGKNVQFGYGCTLIAHLYDNRGLLIKKLKFGDYVIVGGETTIMPGVEMGHHSILASRSLVPPDTVIKPYEYWAGVPAKKIKDIPPQGLDSGEII